jgi:hypothetical protein
VKVLPGFNSFMINFSGGLFNTEIELWFLNNIGSDHAKLKTERRVQKTELTRRSSLRRRRSALDCIAI